MFHRASAAAAAALALAVSGTGRYVRMYGTRRATGYGYSRYEFQVFGSLSR